MVSVPNKLIAILGWGSLVWDPGDLPRLGTWQTGGPALPIEFSRISRDGRLTLVIDDVNGEWVKTRYVLSTRTDINDAVRDLKKREAATSEEYIGYVDLVGEVDSSIHSKQVAVHGEIAKWARVHGFSAAVWTALPSNFEAKRDRPFSVRDACDYLDELPPSDLDKAREYIANAPKEVSTPLRRAILEQRPE